MQSWMGPGSPHLTGPPLVSAYVENHVDRTRSSYKCLGQTNREVRNRIIRLLPCEILVTCFWFLVGTFRFLVGTFGFRVGNYLVPCGILVGSL